MEMLEAISNLMNNTELDLGFWEYRIYGIRKSFESIDTSNEDIFHSSGSEVIYYSEPELCSFIFSYVDSKNILLSIGIDSEYYVTRFVYDVSAIAYFVMNRIEIDDWICG